MLCPPSLDRQAGTPVSELKPWCVDDGVCCFQASVRPPATEARRIAAVRLIQNSVMQKVAYVTQRGSKCAVPRGWIPENGPDPGRTLDEARRNVWFSVGSSY
jgi:hypothetical protein